MSATDLSTTDLSATDVSATDSAPGMSSTVSQTGTTTGAREHARAQAGGVAEAMPYLPAGHYSDLPADVDAEALTWAETVAGGGYTSKVVARGTTLRLTDRDGDACAHVLLYNADQPWERLNVADTVKIPWQAYLGPCHPLLSDQGRVLATIITDEANGAHDALCGCSTKIANESRYGDGSPQGPSPAGRELMKLAAAKHGLTARDIPPSVSFFKRVHVADAGELRYSGCWQTRGYIELRAELPLIVLIANAPHPLDPRNQYIFTTLEVLAWPGGPTSHRDYLWNHSPELTRAFLNTADYARARGLDD
jgi:urea carboxylase-associated protein 2